MKKRFISMAMALLFIASLPISAFAVTYDLADGSIEVNATTADDGSNTTYEVNQHNGNEWVNKGSSTEAPVINQRDSDTKTTTNTVTINVSENATAGVTIENVNIEVKGSDKLVDTKDAAIAINAGNGAAANVTLDNVQIQVSKDTVAAISTSGAGDVIVDLNNQNTVKSGEDRAGVDKKNTGSLTIDDKNGDGGSLDATGGYNAAGIGSGRDGSTDKAFDVVGEIEIAGGTVTATGGTYGAGIGSGSNNGGKSSGNVENITITGGKVTGNGGTGAAGIGSGSNTNGASSGNVGAIEITGGTVTGNGKDGGAGIGGGSNGNVTTVSIKDATVVAVGSRGGAGIGGGYNGKLANSVVISGAANVTSEGDRIANASGAAIGNGAQVKGTDVVNGDGAELDTSGIKNGIITLIANGKTTIITDIEPEADTASQTASPAVKSYSVVDKDGKSISYKTEVKDGVLTVTVDGDYAVLTGTAANIAALTAQGITTVVFVTSGATSTFDLADLSAKGSGTYKLTHDGAAVTFTLDATDISEILK